jgi:hypothetical protein
VALAAVKIASAHAQVVVHIHVLNVDMRVQRLNGCYGLSSPIVPIKCDLVDPFGFSRGYAKHQGAEWIRPKKSRVAQDTNGGPLGLSDNLGQQIGQFGLHLGEVVDLIPQSPMTPQLEAATGHHSIPGAVIARSHIIAPNR